MRKESKLIFMTYCAISLELPISKDDLEDSCNCTYCFVFVVPIDLYCKYVCVCVFDWIEVIAKTAVDNTWIIIYRRNKIYKVDWQIKSWLKNPLAPIWYNIMTFHSVTKQHGENTYPISGPNNNIVYSYTFYTNRGLISASAYSRTIVRA